MRERGSVIGQLLRRGARRWDPNTDRSAERVSKPALTFLLAGIVVNLYFFCHWRYQPMMDLPNHIAVARCVSEWGSSDSMYTDLFDRPDLLSANTLIYSVTAVLGKVIGLFSAMRFLVASLYIVGFPLAALYVLRVFGRSAWGAVLSNALVFSRFYEAGFVNELVGFPIALVMLAQFYLLLRKATVRRAIFLGLGWSVLFLIHAFVFLWLGAVLACMSIVALPVLMRRGSRRLGATALAVVLSVLPSLVLLVRWIARGGSHFGLGGKSGSIGAALDANEAFRRIQGYVTVSHSIQDGELLVWLLLLLGLSVALARLERRPSPPILEMVCVATFISYFFLPFSLGAEGVVAARQLRHAMWLAFAFATPVSRRTSRTARWAVITGILVYSYAQGATWYRLIAEWERTEAAGLATVLEAAPPGLRILYPALKLESSYFEGKPLWHVDGYYMGAGGGLMRDVPGAKDPAWWLHYKPDRRGLPYLSGLDTPDWSRVSGLWDSYDLVLVHDWNPSPEALRAANASATQVVRSGAWELWRKKP